jgi:hypothetical protein
LFWHTMHRIASRSYPICDTYVKARLKAGRKRSAPGESTSGPDASANQRTQNSKLYLGFLKRRYGHFDGAGVGAPGLSELWNSSSGIGTPHLAGR